MAPLSLTATWQSLGVGPFNLQVLTGTVLLQAADRRPSTGDISGVVVTSIVGVDPTPCSGSGEWWAKAIVGSTTSVLLLPIAAEGSGGGLKSAPSLAGVRSVNGFSTPDVTLTAADVGAYTRAQVDAKIAAAIATALFQSPDEIVDDVPLTNAFGQPVGHIAH